MDLSRLQELKKKLVNDKDLLPVWEFFLDHLGDDPAFIERGKLVSHAFLEEILPRLGMQMFPRDAMSCQMRLVRLADQQFIHGAVNVDGRAGGVLFFEESRSGCSRCRIISRPTRRSARGSRPSRSSRKGSRRGIQGISSTPPYFSPVSTSRTQLSAALEEQLWMMSRG